jgi:fatty-acyl-CoA synthase
MMDVPLTTWLLFANAARHHPDAEVITRRAARGETVRHRYVDFAARTQRLMHALDSLGLDEGARVSTLAWNDHRHLEAYFAVPCTGRVLHTANVRLSDDELAFVLGHARARAVLVDPDFAAVVARIRDRLPDLRHVVVLDDVTGPDAPAGAIAYEQLIAEHPDSYPPIDLPETAPAGLCYTSGTTGHPKGVVYTHRSTFLHALAVSSGAGMSIGPGDTVLPQVPMFHASAWGMAHAAVAVGASIVLNAGPLDAADLVAVMRDERVTVAAGVPTVWAAVADALAATGAASPPVPAVPVLPALRHVVCGGSQPPRSLIERYRNEFGITIVQAWGMTETSPLASMAWPQSSMRNWSEDDLLDSVRTRAGLPLPGVLVDLRDELGSPVPFDGSTMGALHVRGPWVAAGYEGGVGAEQFTDDGWFDTGDVAIGHPEGYFVIADRTKDLIKSGGEWISSVDMEAALMAMPAVLEAAVIAVPDPKWQERPLACVVVRSEAEAPGVDVVRSHLEAHGFARWQLPDRVEVIEAVPRTAVGKFDKKALRARFVAGI